MEIVAAGSVEAAAVLRRDGNYKSSELSLTFLNFCNIFTLPRDKFAIRRLPDG